LLADAGFEVHELPSPIGATRKARQLHVRAVVLDQNLPSLDGTQLAALFRTNAGMQDLRVILVSSSEETQMQEIARQAPQLRRSCDKPTSRLHVIEHEESAMQRVLTQGGWVEGEVRGSHSVFRGIPFAKPPLGRLRFRAPEAPEPWSGVRSACAFGPSAPQPSSRAMSAGVPQPQSEDCLYLNVYTPAADAARRPVLFWIHGGAFSLGSGGEPLYDGGALAERGDIVVVTINYRLGALGFLYWSEAERERLRVTANAGCLDQIAALRWVRDNISAFGGDPSQVTIAGESAGAYSVAMLLGMPQALGLFHRAVTQSGARLSRIAGDPLRATHALLRALDIPEQRCEALWDVPAERLLEAQQRVGAGGESAAAAGSAFSPQFDADTLPLPLDQAFARGACAKVPLVIGTNRDEINLFLGPALKRLDEPLADEPLLQQLRELVPGESDVGLRELLEIYRSSRTAHALPNGERALLAAISSDAFWRIPSNRFAEAYRLQQPATFLYLFTYESPAMRGAVRSAHGLELPFMFGTYESAGQAKFAGTGEAVQRLSARMMDSWIAFVRRGDPTVEGPNQAWPAYELEHRPTMVFDRQSGLERAPYEDERAAWDGRTPRALMA
jgi:para-nitrobenzyl esterase